MCASDSHEDTLLGRWNISQQIYLLYCSEGRGVQEASGIGREVPKVGRTWAAQRESERARGQKATMAKLVNMRGLQVRAGLGKCSRTPVVIKW